MKIEYNEDIWNNIISTYLQKIEISNLINSEYINKIWKSETIMFLIEKYEDELKDFLIKFHNNKIK